MPEWKDTTSYSQNNKERTPTCFTMKSGSLSIVITNNHIDYRGLWVMHCYKLGINTFLLDGCKTFADAEKAAIKKVIEVAEDIYSDANGFLDV